MPPPGKWFIFERDKFPGARMYGHSQLLAALFGALLLVAGCDQAGNTATSAGDDVEIVSSTESSQAFGNYELHFNALGTNQLTPEIAQEYGIVRNPNRVMLTLSILDTSGDGLASAVSGSVAASAINLTGQLKNIPVREIDEGDAIYYIGETTVADSETLIFTVSATPTDEPDPFTVRFQKQFFVD